MLLIPLWAERYKELGDKWLLLFQATGTAIGLESCSAGGVGVLRNFASKRKYFECFMFMVAICIHVWSEGKQRANYVCSCVFTMWDKQHQDS